MPRNRPSLSTSHYAIFDYWKDKCIDKYGNVYVEGSVEYSKTEPMVEDWGEPCCWACGKDTGVWRENWYPTEIVQDDDLKKIWNSAKVKHRLERAHILAWSLGGNDNPENLILLCSKCHTDSPDVSNPKMLLSWVFGRKRQLPTCIEVFNKAKETLSDLYNINNPFFSTYEDIRKNTTDHPGSDGFNTFLYALIDDALKNRVQLRGETEMLFMRFIEDEIKELEQLGASMDAIQAYKTCLDAYKMCKDFENNTYGALNINHERKEEVTNA